MKREKWYYISSNRATGGIRTINNRVVETPPYFRFLKGKLLAHTPLYFTVKEIK